MISIIIPTLNEEKNISRVISQFKGMKNIEVIVADGTSDDDTVKIAKKLGAKVFQNPKNTQNIAKNRNLGAKHAKGEILIFCDADTKLKDPKKSLKVIKKRFKNPNLVGAMLKLSVFPKKELIKDKIFLFFYNNFLRFSFFVKVPFSSGQCQIIKTKTFQEIKGYNEKMVFSEDSEIFKRLIKKGKIQFFSDMIVYDSPRRYRKKGYIKYIFGGIYLALMYYIFKKRVIKEWKRVD